MGNMNIKICTSFASSSATYIFCLKPSIYHSFRKWTNSILVLLDLSSAFHTVDPSIPFQRLKHVIGIKGTVREFQKVLDLDQFSSPCTFFPSKTLVSCMEKNVHDCDDDNHLSISIKPQDQSVKL